MNNNTVYITESNFIKIIGKKTGDEKPYKWRLYEILPFWYLQFLEHYNNWLEALSQWHFEKYTWKVEENDIKSDWVFVGWWKPSYHKTKDCIRLNSNYENYEIPIKILNRLRKSNKDLSSIEIEKKWEKIKSDFRKWFFENKSLFENNKDLFYKNMLEKWGVNKFDNISKHTNTWITQFANWTWIEIEEKINILIKKRRDFIFNECNFNEKKIIGFLGNSFYIFLNKWITTDLEFREENEKVYIETLDKFHRNYRWFKQNLEMLHDYWFINMFNLLSRYDNMMEEIKQLIILYINIKNNKNMEFDKSVLETLWFQKCGSCFNFND